VTSAELTRHFLAFCFIYDVFLYNLPTTCLSCINSADIVAVQHLLLCSCLSVCLSVRNVVCCGYNSYPVLPSLVTQNDTKKAIKVSVKRITYLYELMNMRSYYVWILPQASTYICQRNVTYKIVDYIPNT